MQNLRRRWPEKMKVQTNQKGPPEEIDGEIIIFPKSKPP
jgi:hypothetical protein